MSLNLKADIQKAKQKQQQKSEKDYSINKIASGLKVMVKDAYLNGVSSFKDDMDALFDASVMDTLIRDFPNFESVLLLTNDVRIWFG